MDRQNCHYAPSISTRQPQPQPRRLSITLLPQPKQRDFKRIGDKYSKPQAAKQLGPHEVNVLNKLARLVWKRMNFSFQQMQKQCITESDYCCTLESVTGNKVFDLGRTEKGLGLLSGWISMRVQNQLIWGISHLKNIANGKPTVGCIKNKSVWIASKRFRRGEEMAGAMLLRHVVSNRLKSYLLKIALTPSNFHQTASKKNLSHTAGKENKGPSALSEAETESMLRDYELERLRQRVCKLEEHLTSTIGSRPTGSNTSSIALQPPPPPKYPNLSSSHQVEGTINRSGSFQFRHREAGSNPHTPCASISNSFTSDRHQLEKSHSVLPGFPDRYKVQDGEIPTRDSSYTQQRRNNSSFSETDRLSKDMFQTSRQPNPFSRAKQECRLPPNRKLL